MSILFFTPSVLFFQTNYCLSNRINKIIINTKKQPSIALLRKQKKTTTKKPYPNISRFQQQKLPPSTIPPKSFCQYDLLNVYKIPSANYTINNLSQKITFRCPLNSHKHKHQRILPLRKKTNTLLLRNNLFEHCFPPSSISFNCQIENNFSVEFQPFAHLPTSKKHQWKYMLPP